MLNFYYKKIKILILQSFQINEYFMISFKNKQFNS